MSWRRTFTSSHRETGNLLQPEGRSYVAAATEDSVLFTMQCVVIAYIQLNTLQNKMFNVLMDKPFFFCRCTLVLSLMLQHVLINLGQEQQKTGEVDECSNSTC